VNGYTIYGELESFETVALTTTLVAKGQRVDLVPATASLSLSLATRTGRDTGPYLRTPEGVVLADLHPMLEWVERMHPEPRLMPVTPVCRVSARLLEDWIELWLRLWPRRSWTTLEKIGAHLEAAGFLLGVEPCRADWLLAAWLESEVLIHDHARAHLSRMAPRLATLGNELLESSPAESSDDVIPISLLPILEEIGLDYHGYLIGNHRAWKDQTGEVFMDLGFGRRRLPARRDSEARRVDLAGELAAFPPCARRDVRRILEPVGAWYAMTLPPVLPEIDPSDPRSL
jgi:glutathione S-transferase